MKKLMNKIMKRIMNNDGFTLVELMIVISVIAILAVVLVPKVGDMKGSVRDQGVNSNVNSVRAFMELKVNDRYPSAAAEDNRLLGLFNAEFTDGNAIVNPFTNGEFINLNGGGRENNTNYSIIIYDHNAMFNSATYNQIGTNIAYRGKVMVQIFNDAYIVYGMDKNGTAFPYQIVR